LLDEPTTGLHPQEVEKLLDILRKLVSKGNTVVVIEHNLEAICEADTIIDFGPGGGIAGGEIVATGTPQEIAANKDSLTVSYGSQRLYEHSFQLRWLKCTNF
jgi:excinuclease ABC subunit A